MSRQITQNTESDRLSKRVRVALHRDSFARLRRLADHEVLSVSASAAMLIDLGFEAQVALDRLARMAPALASIDTTPTSPKKEDTERIKVPLDDTQFRRLCNLARREFESLATIGGRMIEMGIERYGERYPILKATLLNL